MRSPRARILIVEDNRTLALGLSRSLEASGYEVTVAGDGQAGLRSALDPSLDLAVLDLMLPERSGLEVLRELRAEGSSLPVLILTARGREIDKLRGFRLGADDYVVKPVGVLELEARVEAILRRTRSGGPGPAEPERYRFGDVEVDVPTRTVRRGGEPVELSPLETDLLVCLLRRDGAVVERATLLTEVWGYKRPVRTRTIDTHVGSLRAKLEPEPSEPTHLLTVRKVGYRLRGAERIDEGLSS